MTIKSIINKLVAITGESYPPLTSDSGCIHEGALKHTGTPRPHPIDIDSSYPEEIDHSFVQNSQSLIIVKMVAPNSVSSTPANCAHAPYPILPPILNDV